MAYPSIIQKLMNLRRARGDFHARHVAICREMLVLSNRLILSELELAEKGIGCAGDFAIEYVVHPEGTASGGAVIAPVTIPGPAGKPVTGAALTAVVK